MKKAHSSAAAGGESPQRKISPLFFPVTVSQPTLFRDDGLTVPPFPFGSSSHVVGRVETSRVGEPWDLLRGRCVFRDRETLLNAVSEADLSHWAPNCATFSRAREIPLPGIKNAPRPVRDEASPEGIPAELEKMSGRARKKLEDDTEMADLSARTCLQRHRAGKWFSLEHPGRSLALHLKSWRELQAEPGVMKLEYTTCMYEGSRRRKRQMLLCNHDSFIPMSKVCNGNRMCERTGLPHLKWKPTTSGGRVIQFTTGDEREYPQGFCEQYAECCKDVLKEKGTFVEIFSGPNAPLSAAVCKAFGESLKGGRLETNRGVKQELQRIAQAVENSTKLARPESRPLQIAEVPDGRVSRLNMLESGKQPGYGKRNQLIPDGLNCTKQHLNQALKLEHPFNSMMSLKWDHVEVLQDQITCPRITNEHRLRVLANWRSLAKDPAVQELQREHNATACKNAAKLGLRPKTALMQELGKKYGVEDKDVPLLCLQGMPIVGPALESPFFERHEIPAEISVRELLASSKQRRQHALKRVEYMAKLRTPEQAVAIYTKTLKEVSKGTMDGPFTHEELVQKFGNHYNVIPSFGLEQGTDEAGQPKYRRIDDHTAGHTNLAATRKQKIVMAMSDYLIVMVRAFFERHHSQITIGTEDMQGAYRQLALPDSQTMISVTAVFDPHSQSARMFTIHGQPFGAGHAVPNFYRLAEWACRTLVRGFSLMLDHFFDDFYYIERPECGTVARFCVQEGFKLLGLTLDPDKSQLPSQVAHVLGVAFNTRAILSERVLNVEPKPSRRSNFGILVKQILDKNCLPPSLAASVLGKFGFLCSTLFGKVGRFCTGVVRQSQYSASPNHAITQEIRVALRLMDHIAQVAPNRVCSLGGTSPPTILYTDASDVPGRDPRYGIGGVLIIQHPTFSIQYFSTSVPQSIVDSWYPRATYMGQLEALAAPVSLSTWRHQLKNRQIIHFIDNDAVASSLVKGYSPKADSTWIINEYWSLAAAIGADIYIDRVESKSNLADGPSRFTTHELDSMGARPISPVFSSFHSSPIYNIFREECCAPARTVPVVTTNTT